MHVHHCNICAAAASCIIGSIVWVIMYYREPLCSLSCLNETPNGQRLFGKADLDEKEHKTVSAPA